MSIAKVLYRAAASATGGRDGRTARALIDRAHIVCPYSNATRNNIDVCLSLV